MFQDITKDSGIDYSILIWDTLVLVAENTIIEEVRVEWSSGIIQVVEDVTADQILNLIEPEDNLTDNTVSLFSPSPNY
ncbi:MAG: hypothetical protein WBM86_04755 [Waterburya sp.]